MDDLLKPPTGENPLIVAFRALQNAEQPAPTLAELQQRYAEIFQSPPAQSQPGQIQPFSLTDPNIRTVLTSDTGAARS